MGSLSDFWIQAHEDEVARYEELKENEDRTKEEQEEFEALKAQLNIP